MNPSQILKIDKARMDGADAGTVLASLVKALGEEQGAQAFKHYAQTKMPDGRPRSQVNLGDPAEWHTGV